MNLHQIRVASKLNVAATERWIRWRGRQYPWILPEGSWEGGLWPGIGSGSDNSLPAYLERTGVQKHEGVHNLKSSWILCANLYFPFRGSAEGKALFASFLKRHVAVEIDSLEEIELEYAEESSPSTAFTNVLRGGTKVVPGDAAIPTQTAAIALRRF